MSDRHERAKVGTGRIPNTDIVAALVRWLYRGKTEG